MQPVSAGQAEAPSASITREKRPRKYPVGNDSGHAGGNVTFAWKPPNNDAKGGRRAAVGGVDDSVDASVG